MTLNGVNDDELVEFKIGESVAYRGRERWGVGALASDADALGFRETRQTGGIFEIEAVRRIRRYEFADTNSRASVALPHRRGPSNATTRLRRKAVRTRTGSVVRANIARKGTMKIPQ